MHEPISGTIWRVIVAMLGFGKAFFVQRAERETARRWS